MIVRRVCVTLRSQLYNTARSLDKQHRCLYGSFHTSSRRYATIPDYMVVSEEVRDAVSCNKPVVALESTILTHGMPYPENLRMGRSVEKIIRDHGAVPATIALLDGKAHIGITDTQLEMISDVSSNPAVKVSRRDLAYALNKRLTGGTTISGTMVLAHAAGIRLFVSGGLGGVHRGGETTMDVSADLTELGRTPVALVTSGVKSILDIGRTLEYLETQGVCVATYGPTRQFPAFFTGQSGFESACNVTGVDEAANLVNTTLALGLQNGVLIGNPIPSEYELQGQKIEESIQQAVSEANDAGIKGRDITPFILSRVNELTEGLSLQSNIALVENNAKLGAQIALRMSELEAQHSQSAHNTNKSRQRTIRRNSSTSQHIKRPTVVGACNLDTIMHIQTEQIKFNGQTNHSISSIQCGGVGRNVCDGLSRLGAQPKFLTALGIDVGGDSIVSKCTHMDWSSSLRLDNSSTANYTVVLDKKGDVVLGVGDMIIHDQITPNYIESHEEDICSSSMLILDGNLTVEAVRSACLLAERHQIKVFYEPADADKATKPFKADVEKTIGYIKPNLLELIELYKFVSGKNVDIIDTKSEKFLERVSELCLHVSQYIPNILVTVGAKGVVYCMKREDNSYSGNTTSGTTLIKQTADSVCIHAAAQPIEQSRIKSVSGAGDCLAAGFIFSQLRGQNVPSSLQLGLAAAHLSVQSYETVPSSIHSLSTQLDT